MSPRKRMVCSAAASTLLSITLAASAADLDTLGDLLSPAYLAVNFTAVCDQVDGKFMATTGGKNGSAITYAQHIKEEVIRDLDIGQAQRVLRRAADAARIIAHGFVRGMAGGTDPEVADRMRSWCESTGKTFVSAFVIDHDKAEGRFEAVIKAAK